MAAVVVPPPLAAVPLKGGLVSQPLGTSAFTGQAVVAAPSTKIQSGRKAAPVVVYAGRCPLGFTSADIQSEGSEGPFPSEGLFSSTGRATPLFSETGTVRHGQTRQAVAAPPGMPSVDAESSKSPYRAAPSAFEAELDLGSGTVEHFWEKAYFPQRDQMPHRMITGLRVLHPEDDWFEVDEFYEEEMALRREILETRKPVVVATKDLPGGTAKADAANWELLREASSYLVRRYPTHFVWDGPVLCNTTTNERFDLTDRDLDPLDVLARIVQEDLCVLLEDEKGVSRMVSGAVLYPWRWWMSSKLGMNLRAIHGPVPGYQKLIASPVDSFMRHLAVDKPAWRIGWSITNNPAFYQATDEDTDLGMDLSAERPPLTTVIPVERAGEELFYRVERQTFVRLPKSRAVIFGIRTYVKPLSIFETRPELAGKFLHALSTMEPKLAKYRGIDGFMGTAVEYLKRCAGGELVGKS